MAVTFDNPTNVNGLIIVAFKDDGGGTVSLDVSPYMREIYSVVANPLASAVVARTTFLSDDSPYEFHIPLLVEWSGTTITVKQVDGNVGTVTTTIEGQTSGIVIGRK